MNITEQDDRRGLPSASPWRRYELCNASWQLEQEAKRLGQEAHVSSKDAASGNRIHAQVTGEEVELKESEAVTAEFLLDRADEQVTRIFGDAQFSQVYEKRLWLEIDGKPALSGRFDRVTYTDKVALNQNYKTGWAEPDPAEINAQMKVEAVLIAVALPHITEVIVQIISGPYGVTEGRYNLAALSVAYNDILATYRKIQDPKAAFNPSPEACKYCSAINICQAVKDLVKPVAKLQFSALPDGARGARLLDEVAVLENHFEQIKEYYAKRLTDDPTYQLPGYAMVPGTVKRVVTDWEAARARLGEYLEADQIKGAANYRLGDLEKALGKTLKLKGQPLKERMNEILKGLISEKQNAASLKRVKGEPRVAALVVE